MRRVLLSSFCGLSALAQDPQAAGRIQKDVNALASPQWKGRGNGEEGLEAASGYLRQRLVASGLKVEIQRFPLALAPQVEQAQVVITTEGQPRPLERGKDFEVMGWSGSGEVSASSLLLLGSGLQLHTFQDTALSDLSGKVVVIPRRTSATVAPGATGIERSLSQRIKRLEAMHPAAVLVLEEGAVLPLQREEGPASFAMPVLSIRKGWLDTLQPGLESEREAAAQVGQPFAKDLEGLSCQIRLALRPRSVQLPNLKVEIPGHGGLYAAERIVIGAHMDHLGMGARHSLGGAAAMGVPHLGADDNASGSALVVELARRFHRKPLRRTVTALLFSGEEEGLLGSRAYVDRADSRVKSIRLMANFDMVGRLDAAHPKLLLGAYGAPASALTQAQQLAPSGWTVSGDLGASVGGSDHMSFAAAGIPTFFFFTGLHADYHRPSDTADKINAAGIAELADYAERLLRALDAQNDLPAFDPSTAKSQGAVSPMKVTFGTIPDYGSDSRGFRINGVVKDGAAEAAGLRAGDVITHIAGREVKDIHGYMAILSDLKAGVPVRVRWLRDGQAMEADATPKGRP
jgi:hypothetical protein